MLKLAKLPSNAAKGKSQVNATKNVLNRLAIIGLTKERETKEEKICMLFTHTEKSIIVKFGDSSFGARINATKYERHSHNVTGSTDLQYAGVIIGHIIAQMKNMSNDMTDFIAAIQALNITEKQLHKDSVIAVKAITKWLTEKYPYVEIHTETIEMAELFNMCEGYAKICHELSVKGATATSIRILCNRLVPQEKKVKEK
jgi:hypothetical protein